LSSVGSRGQSWKVIVALMTGNCIDPKCRLKVFAKVDGQLFRISAALGEVLTQLTRWETAAVNARSGNRGAEDNRKGDGSEAA
jgi:hypothetical protein